ncbi:MAG: SIS domain-containing protein [Porticoccus sp.]|jgi:D-sedoheptulose 7-phosphate isomerase|nr:SIS domain-containing protein [Porticoccus sp.]|tara:strand:+ start:1103 stop:1687 length:585 start_codon:yes stop_codon:yes gene_type:complete
MESTVIAHFNQSIQVKKDCTKMLAPYIVSASHKIVQQLLQGRKVLSCGNGLTTALAGILTESLLLQYKLERPGFPAISLNDSGILTAICHRSGKNQIFSKQILALGEPGDLLAIFSSGSNPGNLVQAIQAAHDKSMVVIAFTGMYDKDLSALLSNEDIEIRVEHDDAHRISELQMLSIFCLCELIDQQLFGENN